MRIAITDLSDGQKWSVQGQLVGEWAAELLSTWKKTHHAGDPRRTIVDLIEVTSIDRNGEAVLAEMMSQGAEFISGDVYTEHLLRKLRRELKRRLEKEKQHGGGTKS
jgi:hypothetical protein